MKHEIRKNASRMCPVLLCAAALAAPAWAGHDPGAKFQSMDTNNDGMISSAEHAAAETKMFGEMDTNGDGKVTTQEMDARHAMMKGGKSEPRTMNDAAMDSSCCAMNTSADMIGSMDTDGDGMMSSAEHDAGAASMFTEMDTNGDGNLSKQEMSAGHAMKKSKP